jgi:uncharacterized membrane protein
LAALLLYRTNHPGLAVITGLTLLDWLGLAWFLVIWLGYGPVMRAIGRRRRLINDAMIGVRQTWMAAMLGRENRMPDAALIGHVMRSASFFASTTMLVIAALFGALGNIDRLQSSLETLTGTTPMRPALDLKLALVLIVVVRGFFALTWAIRQFNYVVALIGAAPPAPVDPVLRRALAADLGEVMNAAAMTFNSGIRAYYFALAGLSWLASPVLFLMATSAVMALLLRRQTASHTADVIHRIEIHRIEIHRIEIPGADIHRTGTGRSGPQG